MEAINKKISEYLVYYIESDISPGFAVLLQGYWGCGKTWFIKNFIEEYHEESKHKFLYLSLYGVASTSEIEDQIFQKLHPILSSKALFLTGKILKGIARASLKIDFDGDDKGDGSLNSQVPEINLPYYLKNTSDSVLIFDDLERCTIPLNNLLGYINSFVEHQDLRAIIIANEDELKIKEGDNTDRNLYKIIKEKLIGKTFRVEDDIKSAFYSVIKAIKDPMLRKVYLKANRKIEEVFSAANYHNLRHLKQSLWDFERFYKTIPSKYSSKYELIEDLLIHFLAFSFEIKAGEIESHEIGDFRSAKIRKMVSTSNKNDLSKPIDTISKKYSFLNPFDIILTAKSWDKLFEIGYLNEVEIDECLSKSKYFINVNTPEWIRLWHYLNLNDDVFDSILDSFKKKWDKREYKIPGIILHACGILLNFSRIGLIDKKIEDVKIDCINYIDEIEAIEDSNSKGVEFGGGPLDIEQSYGLGYQSYDTKEFEDVSNHLKDRLKKIKIDNLPKEADELINILDKDSERFCRMIFFNDIEDKSYYETPIFKFMDSKKFLEKLLSLDNERKRDVFIAIKQRYKLGEYNNKLLDEIFFLEKLKNEIEEEIKNRKGTISGHLLDSFSKYNVDKILEKLRNQASKVEG